ncbi:MAG: hypothetical protein GW865_02930 [Candidatus Aenigmarchaeota archaeon]|nr:hypothetical protein [Candidatus Aenigmarchaeota archaeon]
MAKFKLIEKREIIFLVFAVIWSLLWNIVFMRSYLIHLENNPDTPIPFAYITHQIGYIITWGIFSFALLRKPIHITRLTLGTTFLFIAFEIVMPPLCISRQGNILLSPGNMSCLAGNDTFVSWLWSLVGVPYGTPLMFYLTYIFGMVFFFFLAVLFLKERELWRTIAKV